jgi:hypothetical protein
MYIADTYNHRIRKVTVTTGIITTIAGTGTSSYSGDNGPASSAALQNPHYVALDSLGNNSLFFYFDFYFLYNLITQVTCTSLILTTTVSAR